MAITERRLRIQLPVTDGAPTPPSPTARISNGWALVLGLAWIGFISAVTVLEPTPATSTIAFNFRMIRPVRPAEYVAHLEPGEVAPAFDASRFGGGQERVDYPANGGKTFVFVMSLTCGACTKTVPHWNRIADATRGQARDDASSPCPRSSGPCARPTRSSPTGSRWR